MGGWPGERVAPRASRAARAAAALRRGLAIGAFSTLLALSRMPAPASAGTAPSMGLDTASPTLATIGSMAGSSMSMMIDGYTPRTTTSTARLRTAPCSHQ